MKTAHTPGPWSVEDDRKHTAPAGIELVCLTIMPAGDFRGPVAELQSCDHIQGITMAECEANARLIAAAPDLLAAGAAALRLLGQLNNGIGARDGEWPQVVKLRAAIDKARGEA